jgi:hypothetical protein
MNLSVGRVTYDNIWICYAGSIAIIAGVYAVKAVALRPNNTRLGAAVLFFLCLVPCIPITWALSPDWGNRHVLRIAIYVGQPIATLGVPVTSFLFDLTGGTATLTARNRLILHLFEWLVAVPTWFVTWIFIEFLFLGWVWI